MKKQEKEARAWQADNAAATPYIDALLVERPLSKYELVARIIGKADAFTWASGMATGAPASLRMKSTRPMARVILPHWMPFSGVLHDKNPAHFVGHAGGGHRHYHCRNPNRHLIYSPPGFSWRTHGALQGSRYWHGVWIAFDKLWNAILDGDPEETLSSHLGKSTIYGYEVVLWNRWADHTPAWLLHQIDKHHCEKSIDWKVGEPRKPQKLYLS